MILNWIKRKSRGESKIKKSFTIEEAKQFLSEITVVDYEQKIA